jgi:hypothetical protein
MQVQLLVSLFGLVIQYWEDSEWREYHFAMLTRITSYLMTLYFFLHEMASPYADQYLIVIAPMSILVGYGYALFEHDYDNFIKPGSVFGHFIMPYFSLYAFIGLLYRPSVMICAWSILFYLFYYGVQWFFYYHCNCFPYDICDLRTLKGNAMFVSTLFMTVCLTYLHIVIDVTNPWVAHTGALGLVLLYLYRGTYLYLQKKQSE